MEDEKEKFRSSCWDEAVHCFGTAQIFGDRAAWYRRWLRLLTLLGITVPVVVGGVVLSFGVGNKSMPYILGTAGVLGLVQLVGSVLSLVYKWDDELAYSTEAAADNGRLADTFGNLAEHPPNKQGELKARYDILRTESRIRSEQDGKRIVSGEEKRKGMRAALRQYRRVCVQCEQVPASMEASDCAVCGRFGRQWKKRRSGQK